MRPLTSAQPALLGDAHDFVEVFLGHVISLLPDALLQLSDLLEVVALLLMFRLHLEVLQRLVELLVLCALLFLLESLNLNLLLQEPALDLCHMLVRFEHFSQKVIWTRNGHLGLNQELHAFHDIGASRVVAVNNSPNKQCQLARVK